MLSKLDQALKNLREIGEVCRAPQLTKDITEGLQNALDSLIPPTTAADPAAEETEKNIFVPLANINNWAKVIYNQFREALTPESKKSLFEELAALPRNGQVKIGNRESYPATDYETLRGPLERKLQEVGNFQFSNPTEKFLHFDGPPVKCGAHNRPFIFQPLAISGNSREGNGYLRGYFRQMKDGTSEPVCRECQIRLLRQAKKEEVKIYFLTTDQIAERNERFTAEKAARKEKDKNILYGGYNVGKKIEEDRRSSSNVEGNKPTKKKRDDSWKKHI